MAEIPPGILTAVEQQSVYVNAHLDDLIKTATELHGDDVLAETYIHAIITGGSEGIDPDKAWGHLTGIAAAAIVRLSKQKE